MRIQISILLFLLLLTSCSKDNETTEEVVKLPVSTVNYSQMENWAYHPNKTGTIINNYDFDIAVINQNLGIQSIIDIPNNSQTNTGIDVFFVHPTLLSGVNNNYETVPISNQPSTQISATILAQAGLLSKYGRFFAPRYRQCTGAVYNADTPKELQAQLMTTSYSDVKAAFLDYLANYNNGNKIIIAGHSQGSYLLAMLLKDVFDNNPSLKFKLVTAALGGMGYVYENNSTNQNGWWNTLQLGSTMNDCGSIHNWMCHKEEDPLPEPNLGFPAFNQNLVNNGLVSRTINLSEDRFVQDNLYYSNVAQPVRNYIVSDANYNLGGIKNYIAFDNLFTIRFRRDSMTKVAFSVAFTPTVGDLRPNDLQSGNSNPNLPNWGYHPKDYNIYIWALMEQIDLKISNCQ